MNLKNYSKPQKIQKLKNFNEYLIHAAKENNPTFEYEGEEFLVSTSEDFVQTLINNRYLYRIYKNGEKNSDVLIEELVQYIDHFNT
jgi:hypothetical protein